MDTTIALHQQRIFDIVAIERDGTIGNGRHERMLQDAHLVVVDINIGEDILGHRIQHLTRLEEVVDAR